jgi:pyruvate formate lyase activating enzyme
MRYYNPISDVKRKCKVCGKKKTISKSLSVCLDCIRTKEETLPLIKSAHGNLRRDYKLPAEPPKDPNGIQCNLCSNRCLIGKGERGYCGLRWNNGSLNTLSDQNKGLLYMYLDPHVTNCCGAWFCPGGTGSGFPRFSRTQGPEHGYLNLSVFFYGCNFDCMFCQNFSHKELQNGKTITIDDLAEQVLVNEKISCICYFGGSPEPQLPYSLKASKLALEYSKDRVLRLCWEWNGCGDPYLVKEAAELALISGGNIKFDLKCHTPSLSIALSGVDNSRAFSNFKMIAQEKYEKRPEVPMLTATTLIVPGYVDKIEVERIAEFIADLNENIPYSLLLFHPAYAMSDLPSTSLKLVQDCYRAASSFLENVNIGNLHMLGMRKMDDFTRTM